MAGAGVGASVAGGACGCAVGVPLGDVGVWAVAASPEGVAATPGDGVAATVGVGAAVVVGAVVVVVDELVDDVVVGAVVVVVPPNSSIGPWRGAATSSTSVGSAGIVTTPAMSMAVVRVASAAVGQ